MDAKIETCRGVAAVANFVPSQKSSDGGGCRVRVSAGMTKIGGNIPAKVSQRQTVAGREPRLGVVCLVPL